MPFLRILLAGLLLAAGARAQVPGEEEPLFTLIRAQLSALEREDVAAVMATIHPSSPLREATQTLLEKVKENYNLRYTATDLVVVSVTAEEARVAFTQTTIKVSGPQFRNNAIHGVHLFKKDGDAWKFFDSEIKRVEYLDKDAGS